MLDLVDSVGGDENPEWGLHNRQRVLSLLAMDPRPLVRARVAAAASALARDGAEDAASLLDTLARDRSPVVRAEVARAFDTLFAEATPFDRIQLVCRWALSEVRLQREVVARALSAANPVVVADLVIEQLSRDREAAVRWLALRAAAKRYAEAPATYRAIARERVIDPSRRVRRLARRLLNLSVS